MSIIFNYKNWLFSQFERYNKIWIFILGFFESPTKSEFWWIRSFQLNAQKMNAIIDWINPYDQLKCQCGTHWLRGLPSFVSEVRPLRKHFELGEPNLYYMYLVYTFLIRLPPKTNANVPKPVHAFSFDFRSASADIRTLDSESLHFPDLWNSC